MLISKLVMGHTRQKPRLLFLSSQTASETRLSTTNWYPGSRAKYSRCMVSRNLLTVNGGIVFAVFGRYGTRNFWDCGQELKEQGRRCLPGQSARTSSGVGSHRGAGRGFHQPRSKIPSPCRRCPRGPRRRRRLRRRKTLCLHYTGYRRSV